MGNQSNVPQSRRHQDDPIICCGEQPRRQPLEQASPNVMNVSKQGYGRFGRKNIGSEKNEENLQMEQTGSTYYKQKDVTIFRKPGNTLQYSTYQNGQNNQGQSDNFSKDSKQNALKPITLQQSQIKKSGFASFKKSGYGAFNSNNVGYSTFNSYGFHGTVKQSKENIKLNQDPKNHKPTPMVDFVGQKQIKQQIKQQKAKIQSPFVGQGKYGGRLEQFENNKRIIMFLQQNHLKQPEFKFYDTKDDSSVMNNSTIKMAKKKYGKIQQKYLDENSTANLKINQNLAKLQQPIELTFQIDARIILASCILVIAVVILVLGLTIFNEGPNFFICLMIAIILYVCYLLICYIYNDVLEFLYNVRSFSQFEEDYNNLRKNNGQLSYHIHYQTSKKVVKQCYLLSKENKYTRIKEVQNQNKDLTINDLKDKRISFVIVRYKTKTSFMDPESQLNIINYFDEFLEEHKGVIIQSYGEKGSSKRETKKETGKNQKEMKDKNVEQKERLFTNHLKKCDFGYQLDPIQGLTKKPEQVINVCYMEDDDNGCMITAFVIFTLFGMCLPFLLFFEAYTKRYRINILNRFHVGEGQK